MSLSEDVCPLLAARAATDPNAARLLEMFTKADEILSEGSLQRTGDVEMPTRSSALWIAVVISRFHSSTARQIFFLTLNCLTVCGWNRAVTS